VAESGDDGGGSYVSKILSAPREEIAIPPLQAVPIRLEILPQKVNPDYRKQITVMNLVNRDYDVTFEVNANIIDQVCCRLSRRDGFPWRCRNQRTRPFMVAV